MIPIWQASTSIFHPLALPTLYPIISQRLLWLSWMMPISSSCIRLVNHHIERLEHLALIFKGTNTSMKSIENIGDLAQLDTLAIEIWDDVVYSSNTFNVIFNKVASRDQPLSRLTWKGREDTLIYVLFHLQHMALGYELTDSSLPHALLCKPQQSLTLQCSDDVSGYIIDMEQEHFKNIAFHRDSVIG